MYDLSGIDYPKISILIPSYNHKNLIGESISSVWKQNYPNLELVVIDDGSTDGSYDLIVEFAKKSPIDMVVLRQENGGICNALNSGLTHSSGEVVGILASDDLMLPNRLNNQAPLFVNKNLKVLFTNGKYLVGEEISGDVHIDIKKYLIKGFEPTLKFITSNIPALYIQTILIRRNFLIEIGSFDENTGSDDWSLNIRIFKGIKNPVEYKFIDDYSFCYRKHDEQIHKNSNFMTPMIRKVIKKYFDKENRSKFICRNLLKRMGSSIKLGKYKKAMKYLQNAKKISMKKGFPYSCLSQFFCHSLKYLWRKIKLNLSQLKNG